MTSGKTPEIVHPFSWKKLSVISVVTTTGRMYFRIHGGKTIRAEDVTAFLRQALRQLPGQIILYWDGLPQHRSKKVRRFLEKHPRLQVHPLPPYSPDLNPDEGVWNYAKTRELPNLVIKDTIQKKKGVTYSPP